MGFSEALSYGVLAGTSLYCIVNTRVHDHPLELVAYGLTATTALIALCGSQSSSLEEIKEWAEFCETFTFPLLVGNLWLRYGAELYIGYAHPLIMLMLKWIGSDALNYDPSSMVVVGYMINEASCAYKAHLKNNKHALGATIIFFITEMMLTMKNDIDLPETEVINYGLSATILLFFYAFKIF